MSFNITKKELYLSLIILFVTVSVSISVSYFLFNKKVAYVRTGEIIGKYKGIINGNKMFSSEMQIIQANIDTLRNRYENAKKRAEVSNNDKLWYEAGQAEKDFQNYSQKAQEDLKQREQELSAGLLGKINTFIQDYGRNNRYTLILGTTNDGSILYGKEGIDLTNEILTELNKQFVADSLSKK